MLLGAGAKVLGNVEIGRDAKVAAGSVVLHDVPPGATVAGVPARIVAWSSGSVPALEIDQSLPDYEIGPRASHYSAANCRTSTPLSRPSPNSRRR